MICPLDCLLFFYLFFLSISFSMFQYDWNFFLNNTLIIFFFTWLSSLIIFTKNFTASVNNEINWKLEGTNRKTLKAYRFFKIFKGFSFLFFLKFFIISSISCCYNDFKLESIVRVNHFLWVQTIHCTGK